VEKWIWEIKARNPSQQEKIDFIHQQILTDQNVIRITATRWTHLQNSHPGVRREEYDGWIERVWTAWLINKSKSIKRRHLQMLNDQKNKEGTALLKHQSEEPDIPLAQSIPLQFAAGSITTRDSPFSTPFRPVPSATMRRDSSVPMLASSLRMFSTPPPPRTPTTPSLDEHVAKKMRLEKLHLDQIVNLMREGVISPDGVMEVVKQVKEEMGFIGDKNVAEQATPLVNTLSNLY
jgi:hypothetical protein